MSVPSGSGFYTVLGVIAVVALGGYELYKRAKKQIDNGSERKGGSKKKKGKKK